MPASPIQRQEVVDILLHLAQDPAKHIARRTGSTYAIMQWVYTHDGWELCFFMDCGEVDYVEWAKAPDGRYTTYEGWTAGDGWEHDIDPLEYLEEHHQAEYARLTEYMLETPTDDETAETAGFIQGL
jgi:hypothetical protein